MATPKYTPTLQDNLDAYNRVLKAIDAGVISCETFWKRDSCLYEATSQGKKVRCAIGALLTPEQIADIKRLGLNSGAGVYALAIALGKANVHKVTGLTLAQGSLMQQAHDGSKTTAQFRKWVAGKAGRVESKLFAQAAASMAC